MTEARPQDSNTEVLGRREASWENGRKGPEPEQCARLLHLREIEEEFGLSVHHVYRAVHEGRLHPLKRDGKGRIYYAEWEVKILSLLFDLGTAA